MSSTCQNIKTEYDSLKTLKEAFALAYAATKETGDFTFVKQLKKELEKAQDTLEEKLWEPWAKPAIPFGMTLESHKENKIRFPDPTQIELHLEPEQLRGGDVDGDEFLQRLVDKQGLNALSLDFLLTHKELIPENWKKDASGNIKFIHFTDTVYYDPRGLSVGLVFRYLYWSDEDGDWQEGSSTIHAGWRFNTPVAISAS